jgi:hypothetical protein
MGSVSLRVDGFPKKRKPAKLRKPRETPVRVALNENAQNRANSAV